MFCLACRQLQIDKCGCRSSWILNKRVILNVGSTRYHASGVDDILIYWRLPGTRRFVQCVIGVEFRLLWSRTLIIDTQMEERSNWKSVANNFVVNCHWGRTSNLFRRASVSFRTERRSSIEVPQWNTSLVFTVRWNILEQYCVRVWRDFYYLLEVDVRPSTTRSLRWVGKQDCARME